VADALVARREERYFSGRVITSSKCPSRSWK
jgi:hypothetical protein